MPAAAAAGATPSASQFARGAFYGIATVSIWAGWIVTTRLGVTTNLTVFDLAALRFGVGGLLLLPILLHRGFALDRLGWGGLLAIAIGGGAPFVFAAGGGLSFAPVAHAGALFPGVMPLFVALLATAILKEPFPMAKRIGFVLIFAGVLCIAGLSLLSVGTQSIGHALFLTAAFLWACYTVAMRRAGLDGLHAAAISCVISMTLYLPVYALVLGGSDSYVPFGTLAFHGFYQGVLTMVVSLFLFGRAVSLLGASNGAAFGALGPALATLFAIPILGEIPSGTDWLGIAFISCGVYLASGGPLPRRTSAASRS